jgi:uncharacterized membrane protein YedE/YeeE
MVRFFAILLGIALLFWVPLEDASENLAILFAYFISSWLVGALLIRYKNPTRLTIIIIIFAGILTGATITPLILLLMVLKVGLHAHLVPDYSFDQFITVINRTPIWFISGFLTGIGIGIIRKSICVRQEPNCATEC